MAQKAFTTTGPFGINVISTSNPLHVVGAVAGDDKIAVIQNTNTTGAGGFVASDDAGAKFMTAGILNTGSTLETTTYGAAGEAFIRASSSALGLTLNAANSGGYIRFRTGNSSGSERVRINSNGYVGIGKSTGLSDMLEVVNPSGRAYLTLTSTGATTAGVKINSGAGSSNWQLDAGTGSVHNLRIYDATNSVERVRIESNGFVGIGTDTPGTKLDIANPTAGVGALAIRISNGGGSSGDDSRLIISNTTTTSALILRSSTHATEPNAVVLAAGGINNLLFYTNGSERARIDGDGHFYIGVKTPLASPYYAGSTVDSLIQVTQTSFGDAAIQINRYDTTNAAATPVLLFTRSRGALDVNTVVQLDDALGAISATGATGTNYREATRILSQVDSSTITSTSLPGRLVFMTTSTADSSPVERMRISSTGYVHIGAAGIDPVFPFQVVTAGTQTSPMMSLRSTTSAAIGAGGGLVLQGNTNGTGSAATFAGIVGAKENATAGNTAGYLLFAVNNGSGSTERMRITSTGAIALSGVTNTGTTGQALLSNGSGAAAWGNVSATSLSGQVPAANGGTGLNITGSGVVVYSSGVGALTSTTGTGSVVLSAAPTLTGLVTASGSIGVGTSSPFTTTAVNAGKTAENTSATGVYGSAILGTTNITASRAVTGVNGTASSALLNATAFSPYVYGGNFSSTHSGGNTTEIGGIYGIISSASFSTSNATYNKFAFVYGSSNAAAVSGSTAQVGTLSGQVSGATVDTGSTASTVKGVDAAFTIKGTATNAYGVYSQVRTNTGGTVTNSYAFYGGISTSGTITNRYGIFIAGNTGNNYFGDALQVGGGAITGSSSAGVGIGVTPTGTVGSLRVSDAIYTTNGVSTTHTGVLYYTGGSYRLEALGASVPIAFATNGSVRATIDTSGILNVGGTVTGDAKIQSPNGIRIGGTASSDANTLDYYQEGTWTPTVVGATTAGTGTYSAQYGSYTRIGNRVQFSAVIQLSAHTGTGNIRISGLPFTSIGYAQVVNIMSQNLTFTGQLSAYVASSTSNIELVALVSNATWNPVLMDTVFNIWINGIYQVA